MFIGPEPACGISTGVAKKAVRDYRKYWDSLWGLKGQRHSYRDPSANKTREMLNLNRDQLQWGAGLFTEQSPKRTPFQTGTGKTVPHAKGV
jgi:hypothetical protein